MQVRTFEGHTGAVTSVSFTPDGKRVISGSRDKLVKIWDLEIGAEVSSAPVSMSPPQLLSRTAARTPV